MLIQRILLGRRKSEQQTHLQPNSDSELEAQPPIFQDHHHDLLVPAPLMPPHLATTGMEGEEKEEVSENGPLPPPMTVQGDLEKEDFVDTSTLFPEGLLPDNHGDSIVQLSQDLQRPSAPARNPEFATGTHSSLLTVNPYTTSSIPARTRTVSLDDVENLPPTGTAWNMVAGYTVPYLSASPSSSIHKGFPPCPPEQYIPIVNATMIVEDDDALYLHRSRRANTFPPCYEPYTTVATTDTPRNTVDSSNYAANTHCMFIPSTSQVEHVTVDGSEDFGFHSTSHTEVRQHSSPLPFQVEKLLWKTRRLSRSVCKKTLRIAKEQVGKTKPTLQHFANRSACFAKQTSQTIQQQLPIVQQQAQNTVKHVQRSSCKVYQSIIDWDSRHQISHSVCYQTKQGWKVGKNATVKGLRYSRANTK